MSTTLNTRIQYKYDTEKNWNSSSFISLAGELYVYSVDENYDYTRLKVGDGVHTVAELPFAEVGIEEADLIPISVPSTRDILTYNGEIQTPTWMGYNSTKITMSGQTNATDAGSYTVTFTPNDGYCWEDGSVEDKSIIWTIGKVVPNIKIRLEDGNTYNPESVTLKIPQNGIDSYYYFDIIVNPFIEMQEVWQVTNNNDSYAEFNIEASDTSDGIIPYFVSGWNIGSSTINITIPGTNNWDAASVTVNYTVTENVSSVLNDCSWETISNVAKAGKASNYWNIGDLKAVEVQYWALPTNVSVSGRDDAASTTLNGGTYYVQIIGFNHESTNTIDFQMFSDSSGTPMCMYSYGCYGWTVDDVFSDIDNYYWFNWYEDQHSVLSPASGMRTESWGDSIEGNWLTIYNRCLDGSINNYPYNTDGRLMNKLPSDLTSVMVAMNNLKYFDCAYGGIGTYNDYSFSCSVGLSYRYGGYYLTFPSVTEIWGSFMFEAVDFVGGSPQYEYYSSGNSKERKPAPNGHTHTGYESPYMYWTRDHIENYIYEGTAQGTDSMFLISSDPYNVQTVDRIYAIAPIFRVGGGTNTSTPDEENTTPETACEHTTSTINDDCELVCSSCGKVLSTGHHDWQPTGASISATCTTDGFVDNVCSRCGATESYEVAAYEHDYIHGIVHIEKYPTCVTEGLQRTYCANGCGEYIDEKTIPATGEHNTTQAFDPSYGIYTYCTVCGASTKNGTL